MSRKFIVAHWKDEQGLTTTCLLDEFEPIYVYQRTKRDAIQEIKKYLAKVPGHLSFASTVESDDATLSFIKVPIRPEYHTDDRVFPASRLLELRLPYIWGPSNVEGLGLCFVPTLDLSFDYYLEDKTSLSDIIIHKVQNHLRWLTPEKALRFLPPVEIEIEAVHLNVYSKPSKHVRQFPKLSKIAEEMNRLWIGSIGGKPFKRDTEVRQLAETNTDNSENILLVGEPGVGKTAILCGMVHQIIENADDSKPAFWYTSAARIIAGMAYLGEWEERLEAVIGELSSHESYLCFESLRDILFLGGEGVEDSIASFLLPYLKNRQVHLIIESTPLELDSCRQQFPGFIEQFQIFRIPEMDREQVIDLFRHYANNFCMQYDLSVENGVVENIYRLFKRFIPYQVFPGQSLTFLKNLFEQAYRREAREVMKDDVVKAFLEKTGLSEQMVRDEIVIRFDDIVEKLSADVIGQEGACEIAARTITAFKAGLNDPERPVSVLLFCGPTGVGKTQLAKSMASLIFQDDESSKDRFIRLDMSEFGGADATFRIVGDARERGFLINAIRRRPFSIVLLDEIEKAHPDVFDLFLNLFDEGYIKDAAGRVTYFRSSIIIMTSNIGTSNLTAMGFGEEKKQEFSRDVYRFFRPEFFNRIDSVISFSSLDASLIRQITIKELKDLEERAGIKKRKIKLQFSDAIIDHLAQVGFDPKYGARPLQRSIEERITAELSRYLLERDIKDKSLAIDLDEGGQLTFVASDERMFE